MDDENVLLEGQTFEDIIERMLEHVPDTLDKREGSVIYNALAPVAWETQLIYEELNMALTDSFADTASLDALIRKARERGIIWKDATASVVKGLIEPTDVDALNCRFALADTELVYLATKKIDEGVYELTCETPGIEGNVTDGQLVPIYSEDAELDGDIKSAYIGGILTPGAEPEDTEDLRVRYFAKKDQSFGGNIASYVEAVEGMAGVSVCKVIPLWNGAGTVKIILLDSAYNSPAESLITDVQTAIDPTQNQGLGLGLAAIGATVTVVGAADVKINVETSITYANGNHFETAKAAIETALDEYYESIRKSWKNDEFPIIRISQIETRLLNLDEVLDVENTTINGSSKNISLEYDQVPVRGDFVERT